MRYDTSKYMEKISRENEIKEKKSRSRSTCIDTKAFGDTFLYENCLLTGNIKRSKNGSLLIYSM